MNANAWRALVSALADDRCRAVYARLVLGEPADTELSSLSPGAARRVIAALTASGLVRRDGDVLSADPDVFARALEAAPAPARPVGTDRFFEGGRLAVYPAREADRRAVLLRIAHHVAAPDDRLDERTVNDRLTAVTDDVAAMRRYLVDAGLLTRTADGRTYARAGDGAPPCAP